MEDEEEEAMDDSDDESAAGADCPHENGTVFLFGPYEANQPAGVNWRAGVDHAIAEAFIRPEHRDLLVTGDSPVELLEQMQQHRLPPTRTWIRAAES